MKLLTSILLFFLIGPTTAQAAELSTSPYFYGGHYYRGGSVGAEARRMGFSYPSAVRTIDRPYPVYRYRTRYVSRPYPVEVQVPVPVSDLDYDFNYDVPLVDINSCGCPY